MKDESLEQIREDIEARQRATVWPDTVRNGRSIDAFLWKGDPNAKPIQRAGLVVCAFPFFFMAAFAVATPLVKNFKDSSIIGFFVAVVPLLISARLIRNAFLRPAQHRRENQSD